MIFFKSKAEKELDEIIRSIDMNCSNNYKDNAQADFKELVESFERMKENGQLKEKALHTYEDIIAQYTYKLKGYTHKDQTPYWK